MNPNPDVHGYLLNELSESESKAVEAHLAAGGEAAAEAQLLQATIGLLRSLPEEEPPRRIAFVSDKVFEPTRWQRFWNSASKLGFASAAMLAAAILSHAMLTRPQPTATPVAAGPSSAEIRQMVEQAVSSAVSNAVAEVRSEQQKESARLVAAAVRDAERRFAREREEDRAAMEETLVVLRKQVARFYVASNDLGGLR